MGHNPDYSRAEELLDIASNNHGIISREYASSFVVAAGYDMVTHNCVIYLMYKGKVKEYPYPDMSFDLFVEFDGSESKGVFYNDKIKPKRYPTHSKDSEKLFEPYVISGSRNPGDIG